MTMPDKLWELLGVEGVAPATIDKRALQIRAEALISRTPGLTEPERNLLLKLTRRLRNGL